MSSSRSATDHGSAADDFAARLAARFGPVREVVPLAPDASVRRFFRLTRARGNARIALVDRDGGPAALERMTAARALLAAVGVRVPKIEDRDDTIPALLFEDFGDLLLADALPSMTRAQRVAAYAEAGRMAGRIARLGTAKVTGDHALAAPRLERPRLRWELALFATQDVAGRRGVTDTGLFRDLAELSDRICAAITAAPPRLAHRDYHARNLMVLEGGQLGVLDFQDTLFAPPYYDLASLVRDPYVEPERELAVAAAHAFAENARLSIDPLEDPLFSWVALQRDLKALGTYAFQARWRKRTRFLEYVPPAERMALVAVERLPDDVRTTARVILTRLGFAAS
jgi:aminoglycoside/choline kinase family phosphotransferase